LVDYFTDYWSSLKSTSNKALVAARVMGR
jgi:hypothetical protein